MVTDCDENLLGALLLTCQAIWYLNIDLSKQDLSLPWSGQSRTARNEENAQFVA